MALKLDAFVQRKLLDLAAADRSIASGRHRRASLPELKVIADGTTKAATARNAVIAGETEVSDLVRATRKLDAEVDQVRARAARDADRLTSGSAGPKELENLQHEIESLKRRQGTLEDAELELMEERETAEATLAQARAALVEIEQSIAVATTERDRQFALIDAKITADQADRADYAGAITAEVLALYDRIAATGQVAAADLAGGRCGGCRIEIDRIALAEIRSTPIDQIVRCPECGAILVR